MRGVGHGAPAPPALPTRPPPLSAFEAQDAFIPLHRSPYTTFKCWRLLISLAAAMRRLRHLGSALARCSSRVHGEEAPNAGEWARQGACQAAGFSGRAAAQPTVWPQASGGVCCRAASRSSCSLQHALTHPSNPDHDPMVVQAGWSPGGSPSCGHLSWRYQAAAPVSCSAASQLLAVSMPLGSCDCCDTLWTCLHAGQPAAYYA